MVSRSLASRPPLVLAGPHAGGRELSVWGTFWQDPEDAARPVDLALLRRGWEFVRPHRAALLVYLLAVAASALFEVAPALVIRQIVDSALARGDSAGLLVLGALLLVVFAAGALLSVGERLLSVTVGSGVTFSLRSALYRKLQWMPVAFFTRARQGMIQNRVIGEGENVQELFTSTLSSALTDALGLLATLVAMFALSPVVALAVLLLVPLAIAAARVVASRSRELNRRSNQLASELSAHVAERLSVGGALLARIFGGQDEDLRRFDERVRAARRNTVQMEMLHIGFVNAMSLIGSLAVVAIYLVGGWAVIGHALSLGTLIALATLAQQVYAPILHLASIRLNLVSGLVALERVFEVLDKEPMVQERPRPVRPERLLGRVEAEGVWFRYPAPALASIASLETDLEGRSQRRLSEQPSEWILREVSLLAEPGTVSALVGPTGAGKTSLCYLLARLYDVDRGAIRIDGVDIRELAFDALTGALAMVPQDPHLFHDTIRANLLYARPGAGEEELYEACRRARIHELIESLPEGYETMAGERGYRFSGGERQRLAIARAILKNPRILILDEATSYLDNETEALVQEALREVMRGRTSFVIAHRLTTVRAADQILVLDRGRIVERGDHRSLLAANGLYHTLYEAGLPVSASPQDQRTASRRHDADP